MSQSLTSFDLRPPAALADLIDAPRPSPHNGPPCAAGEDGRDSASKHVLTVKDAPCPLPAMDPLHDVVRDYETTGLSLKSHPVAFLRSRLERRGVLTATNLRDARRCPHGHRAAVAGVVLCRQRPGTARGVLFMTLEDETGRADLIVRPHIYTTYRRLALHAGLVIARGRVERQGLVVHLLVERFEEADAPAKAAPEANRDPSTPQDKNSRLIPHQQRAAMEDGC